MPKHTPEDRTTILDAALAAANRSRGGLSEAQLESARLARVEKVANALGANPPLAEAKREHIALFNFQMLSGLFDVIPYPSVSARDAWLKYRELSERLVEDGGQSILLVNDVEFYEIPPVPDDYTQSQRLKMHRSIDDMKRFGKEALIVENLPQLETLENNSLRYGGLTTAKSAARDIYEIYGPPPQRASLSKRLIRRVISWRG